MSPRSHSYSHSPLLGAIPALAKRRVRNPVAPKDARKAKARATPPNCARTPHKEVTKRLVTPFGGAVDTAYASSAPSTAPATAVTADSTRECQSADVTAGSPSARRFARVGRPPLT